MTQLFKNNAFASLAAELSAAGTLATLATGQGARFPAPSGGNHFLATLILLDGNGAETAWEIVKCTTRSNDVLIIERAQEGTVARYWAVGSRIEMRVTAGTLDNFTDTEQAAAVAPVQSVAGKNGNVTLAKEDVGLSNVDNTSDITKNNATVTLTNKTLIDPVISGGEITVTTLMQKNRIDANWTIPNGINAVTIGPFEVNPDVTIAGIGNSTWRGL